MGGYYLTEGEKLSIEKQKRIDKLKNDKEFNLAIDGLRKYLSKEKKNLKKIVR